MTRHKHADIIHEWAEGATIQGRADANMEWLREMNPGWYQDWEYRVEPRTVKREGWVNIVNIETTMGAKIPFVASQIHSTKEAAKHACLSAMDVIKIEWLEDV